MKAFLNLFLFLDKVKEVVFLRSMRSLYMH
jgi:hypothetical protein